MAKFEFIVREADGDRAIPFPASHFQIGSAEDCDVRFDADSVEAHHAEIFLEAGAWFARDIAGSNTVSINGVRTLEGPLTDGTVLKIGAQELVVCVEAPQAGATDSSPMHTAEGVVEPTRLSGVHRPEAQANPEPTRPTPVNFKAVRTVGLTAGAIIDRRYRIVSRIAAGGMGEVYRAEHIELRKPVALKVMLADLSGDDEFVTRFKREAIASSRIGQQNIVDISDFGRTEDGRFYFVMELVDGTTLKRHLRTEGAFAPLRAIHVGLQVARALAAAHAQGIIHRDLKPENIMLVQRPGQPDFVKVLDFGVAKVANTGLGAATAIGMIVGTPQYMAPEQASGIGVDARSDVYSLGLILHELIGGTPTFTGETPPELMAMQMNSDPPRLRPDKPIPRALEQLVYSMLEKRPEARPQTMHEVVEQLEEAASVPTPAARTLAAATAAGELKTQPGTLPGIPETRASPSLAPMNLTGFPRPRRVGPSGPHAGEALPAPSTGTVVGESAVPAELYPPTRAEPLPGVEDAAPPTESTDLEAAIRPSRAPLVVVGLVGALLVTAVIVWAVWRGDSGVVVTTAPLADSGAIAGASPEVPKPDGTKPDGTKPDGTKPDGTKPDGTKPDGTKPDGTKPDGTKPDGAKPDGTKPDGLPVKQRVKLVISTVPERAEVYEGDVLLGNTPLTMQREPGQLAELRFLLKGYKDAARKVRFESDTGISVELEKAKASKKGPGPKPPPPDEGLKDLPF